MLSLEVCKKCHKRYVVGTVTRRLNLAGEYWWTCVLVATFIVKEQGPIPESCLCKFEQSVASGMEGDRNA